MKSVRLLLAWVVAVLLIQGCGGGGVSRGGDGTPPTELTRQRIANMLVGSQLAMTGGGFQSSAQADSMNGSESGGGSMMFIGSYIRGLGPSAMSGGSRSRQQGDDDGGSSGGGGGDDGGGSGGDDGTDDDWNPYFYYDEYLGLWVENQESEQEWVTLLWEDEAKTKAAGSFRTTFEGSYETFPFRYLSTYEITAGTMAGANGRYEVVQSDESTGSMSYESHWPGYGDDAGTSAWGASGYTWNSKTTLEDGTWYRHEGRFDSDGSGSATSEDSQGYRWTYRYNADGTGSGLIEGPDPGLPAKVSWGDGKYRIEYADGTVEEWDMWACMDDVVSSDEDDSPPPTDRSKRYRLKTAR